MNPNFISIEAWVVYDFYNNFYYKRENIFAYRSHKNFNIRVYTQTGLFLVQAMLIVNYKLC